MVKRNMERYNVPLSRHGWCQLHCARVRNHLASRKLDWKTPMEKLTGDTPDISMFRFHFWEPIEYLDPSVKQPASGWKKGRFLGINWDAGDDMTFFVETEKSHGEGRNVILTRSNVRSRTHHIPTSGEINDILANRISQNDVNNNQNTGNNIENNNNNDDEPNIENNDNNDIENNNNNNDDEPNIENNNNNDDNEQEIMVHKKDDIEIDDLEIFFQDDTYYQNTHSEIINEKDDLEDMMNISEEITNTINADEEDYEFRQINSHRWDSGILMLIIELESGQTFESPFAIIKKDRPIELATYIKNNVIERKRNGK